MPVYLVGDAKCMVWSKGTAMLLVRRDVNIKKIKKIKKKNGNKKNNRNRKMEIEIQIEIIEIEKKISLMKFLRV